MRHVKGTQENGRRGGNIASILPLSSLSYVKWPEFGRKSRRRAEQESCKVAFMKKDFATEITEDTENSLFLALFDLCVLCG